MLRRENRSKNVPTVLAMFDAALHIGPKASVNLVPAIYTSLPRALYLIDEYNLTVYEAQWAWTSHCGLNKSEEESGSMG